MGAELFVAIVREPDWSTIDEKILDIPDADLIEYAVEFAALDFGQEEAQLTIDTRESLLSGIGELHEGGKLRDFRFTYICNVEGVDQIVTGGVSWGDNPSDEWDAVNAIDYFKLNE